MCVRERRGGGRECWDGGGGQEAGSCFLHFPVLSPDSPCMSAAVGNTGPGRHTRGIPRTAGWTRRPLPRHVPFLFHPSGRPPWGPIPMVVLWKVSAPRATLWPDVVIRNSYKRRQNTRREGRGARVPEAAAANM